MRVSIVMWLQDAREGGHCASTASESGIAMHLFAVHGSIYKLAAVSRDVESREFCVQRLRETGNCTRREEETLYSTAYMYPDSVC